MTVVYSIWVCIGGLQKMTQFGSGGIVNSKNASFVDMLLCRIWSLGHTVCMYIYRTYPSFSTGRITDTVQNATKHCSSLHCALSLAAQCDNYCYRSCLFATGGRCVFVALCVCYHDNSKLRASIFTKLGLQVKVVTICS